MGVWQWLQTIFGNGGDGLTDKQLLRLENFVQAVKTATARQVIHIQALPSANLAITDSKFGGIPYLPKGATLPTARNGKPLFMLAQINCSQLPENNIYPKKGLLQIWVAANGKYAGNQYYSYSPHTQRVIYYPTLEEATDYDKFKQLYQFEGKPLPFAPTQAYRLIFTKGTDTFSYEQLRFNHSLLPLWKSHFGEQRDNFLLLPEKIAEKLKELLPASRGHCIGGYSEVDDNAQAVGSDGLPKILLLRIDTDEKAGIRCKDNEAVNFLIEKEDFEALDFSKIQHSL